MSRPTKAEQAAKKEAERARFQRIMRGRVVMLLWPADPAKGEQKAYCSARCILNTNGWDWRTPASVAEQQQMMEGILTEWDQAYRLTRKGQWPLARYEDVRPRPYAADVDDVKCAYCRKALRSTLTPKQRKAKQKELREKARRRQETWKATVEARKAAVDARKSAERRAQDERERLEKLEERRERNRIRMAKVRAEGKASITDRLAKDRAKKATAKQEEQWRTEAARLAREDKRWDMDFDEKYSIHLRNLRMRAKYPKWDQMTALERMRLRSLSTRMRQSVLEFSESAPPPRAHCASGD